MASRLREECLGVAPMAPVGVAPMAPMASSNVGVAPMASLQWHLSGFPVLTNGELIAFLLFIPQLGLLAA